MTEGPLITRFLAQQGAFMGYLLAITRDLDAAEEVFQNAVLVIMNQPDPSEIREFLPWAKGMVRRQALQWLREHISSERTHSTVRPELLAAVERAFAEDDSDETTSERELEALRRCLAGVPATARAMLDRRFQAHASFDAIAREFQTSSGAVQRAISRLRIQLRHCIERRVRTVAS